MTTRRSRLSRNDGGGDVSTAKDAEDAGMFGLVAPNKNSALSALSVVKWALDSRWGEMTGASSLSEKQCSKR